ncbi:hypothetical protein ACFVUS_10880 [Nocardia sp. NPDC058058]|uniref:hypothetical protein n=1 Tax=Nocardia sp. NPDC058058 TaxID=3346317 RepID=UPI0036D7A97B
MRSRWKQWSEQGIPIPVLGLVAGLLLVVATVGVMSYRNWELSGRNDALENTLADYRHREADCTAAIKAGTDFLLAANNFDYRKPDDWTVGMAALTAGPVHDYFATPKVAQDNTELIKAGKLRKTATVSDAACTVRQGDGVRVIARIDESTQNFQTPDPVKTTSAVWVQLSRDSGSWKAVDSGRGDQALRADLSATQPPVVPTTAPAPPR